MGSVWYNEAVIVLKNPNLGRQIVFIMVLIFVLLQHISRA